MNGLARLGDQYREVLADNAVISAVTPIAAGASQDFGPFACNAVETASGHDTFVGMLIADQEFSLTLFQGAVAGGLVEEDRTLVSRVLPSGNHGIRIREPRVGEQVTFRVTNTSTDPIATLQGILALHPVAQLEQHWLQQQQPEFLKVTHWSPADGVAVYTAGTQVTCAGFPFVVDDSVCRVVAIWWEDGSGNFRRVCNGYEGVAIAAAADVITVTGAPIPFAPADIAYYVEICYQDKSFTAATDSKRTQEIDPLNEKYVEEELEDTTNLAANTYYYPSSDGMPMAPFKDLSIQGEVSGGVTVTVEARQNVNGTWLDVTPAGYELLTNALGNANFVDTNFILDFDVFNVWRYRIKVVTSDATNAVGLWIRRKAL